MNVVLQKATSFIRVFELWVSENKFLIEYQGSLTGMETLSVNGTEIAKKQRHLSFVLRFNFLVDYKPALLEVRTWPWMTVRAVTLWVEEQLLYSEGTRLLAGPKEVNRQEVLEWGRKTALGLLGCGGFLLGMNVVFLVLFNRFFFFIVLAFPALFIGMGGCFDPRLCLLGKYAKGQKFPFWTKVVGNLLLFFGFALGLSIVIFMLTK